MNIWIFLIYFFVYSLVSTMIFTITSGGWSGLIYIFYGVIYYFILHVILFIASIIKTSRKSEYVRLPGKIIGITLITQCVAILFNRGDCGDGPGRTVFIEMLFYDSSTWCSTDTIFTPIAEIIHPIAIIIYIILIAIFVWSIVKNRMINQDHTSNSIDTSVNSKSKMIFELEIGAILLLASLGFLFFGFIQISTKMLPFFFIVICAVFFIVIEGLILSRKVTVTKTLIICCLTLLITIGIFYSVYRYQIFSRQVSCLNGITSGYNLSYNHCIVRKNKIASLKQLKRACSMFSENKITHYTHSIHITNLPQLSHRDFCYVSYAESIDPYSKQASVLTNTSSNYRPPDSALLNYRVGICKLLSTEHLQNECLEYFIIYVDYDPQTKGLINNGSMNKSDLILPLCSALTSSPKPPSCQQ